MKLWILKPINEDKGAWDPWYDKAFGFIVSAKDETSARLLAHVGAGDENHGATYNGPPMNPWLDPMQSTCVPLKVSKTEEVVMRDFSAA